VKAILIILISVFTLGKEGCFAQTAKQSLFTQIGDGLEWENEGELFRIEPFGQNTLRFRSSKSLKISDEIWNILSQPGTKPVIEILEGKAIISNGNIRAEIPDHLFQSKE